MNSSRKATAVEQMLLGLSGRKPSEELVAGYCAVIANESSLRVESACARLLAQFRGRMVPAVVLAECRKIEAEIRSREMCRGARKQEPPEGQRWLTPEECRQKLEALKHHPVPEERNAASFHRSMLHAYARGAER